MKCNGCPFNDGITEEATIGQNYGCLPTSHTMIEIAESGRALSCHDNGKRPCGGLVEKFPAAAKLPVWPYSKWYQGEEQNVENRR